MSKGMHALEALGYALSGSNAKYETWTKRFDNAEITFNVTDGVQTVATKRRASRVAPCPVDIQTIEAILVRMRERESAASATR